MLLIWRLTNFPKCAILDKQENCEGFKSFQLPFMRKCSIVDIGNSGLFQIKFPKEWQLWKCSNFRWADEDLLRSFNFLSCELSFKKSSTNKTFFFKNLKLLTLICARLLFEKSKFFKILFSKLKILRFDFAWD